MRVLLIDDDVAISQLYIESLHERGWDITYCSSSDEALSVLQGGQPIDVIIQDVMRPSGASVPEDVCDYGISSGIAFHRLHIQNLAPKSPVIYLTNTSVSRFIDQANRLPNSTYLSKFETVPSALPDIVSAAYKKALELLYEQTADSSSPMSALFTDTRKEVLAYFARHPERLHDLSPRTFERFVADILVEMGFEVELTKATRDGGVDIYAILRHQIGSFLMLVECKKWASDNPVGIDVVQRLYGIQIAQKANKSMIVTTSHFTKPATNEAVQYSHLMDLRDYDALRSWLAEVTIPQ